MSARPGPASRRWRRSRRAAALSASGFCDSRYQVQLRPLAVVSWPATMSVMASSMSSRSDMGAPVSLSRASMSICRKSKCSLFSVAAALRERADELGELAKLVGELEIARRLLGDDVERIAADLLRQPLEVRAEDRQQHDFERELAHVVGDVHELAARGLRFPLGDEALVAGVDELRELGDDAAMERRLHHVALAFPQIAFAGHDAVAEQDLDPVQPHALGVVLVVRHQHALDIVGMVDEPHVRASRRASRNGRCRRERANEFGHALDGVVVARRCRIARPPSGADRADFSSFLRSLLGGFSGHVAADCQLQR